MLLIDLEDLLTEALGEDMPNFTIETNDAGEIVIFTGLTEDDDGEIVEFDNLDDVELEENEGDNHDDD